MIKFTIGEKKFGANFVHRNCSPLRSTECELKEIITKDGVDSAFYRAEGRTIVNEHDNYDRRIGRKLSFLRALKQYGFSKSERTIAWEEFKKQCKYL